MFACGKSGILVWCIREGAVVKFARVIFAVACLLALAVMLTACGAAEQPLSQKLGMGDAELTVNDELQQRAEELLADQPGCIIVMESETGKICALATSMTDDGKPKACVRAIPGSLFKVVTLSAALERHRVSLTSTYPSPNILTTSGGVISCYTEPDADTMTIEHAFAQSCNTVFARLAYELGPTAIIEQAEQLGFGEQPCDDFACDTSAVENCDAPDDYEMGWLGCGQAVQTEQGLVGPQVTPVHMAELFATFANDGTMPRAWIDASHEQAGAPEPLKRDALSPKTVDAINDAMELVVQEGTGRAAAVSGAQVRGKTGTAENADGSNTGWFCGNFQRTGKSMTVVVQLEGTGSADAAELAAKIIGRAL